MKSISVQASYVLRAVASRLTAHSGFTPVRQTKQGVIWVFLALAAFLQGCTAVSMMTGTKEPDITGIRPGDQRSSVEKLLGKPLWSPGMAHGVSYVVYEWEIEREAEPGKASLALFLDYLSLGAFEKVLADAGEFECVKQIAVGYDEHGRVHSVSPDTWYACEPGPCRRMRHLVPADSGVHSDARPPSMVSSEHAGEAIATLEVQRSIDEVIVDGQKHSERIITLAAGPHSVTYATVLGGSIMLGPMLQGYQASFDDMELLAGRLYRLQTKRFYFWGGRTDVFWLEDADSKETLACAGP